MLLRYDVDHSLPSKAEVMNKWSNISTSTKSLYDSIWKTSTFYHSGPFQLPVQGIMVKIKMREKIRCDIKANKRTLLNSRLWVIQNFQKLRLQQFAVSVVILLSIYLLGFYGCVE